MSASSLSKIKSHSACVLDMHAKLPFVVFFHPITSIGKSRCHSFVCIATTHQPRRFSRLQQRGLHAKPYGKLYDLNPLVVILLLVGTVSNQEGDCKCNVSLHLFPMKLSFSIAHLENPVSDVLFFPFRAQMKTRGSLNDNFP